MKNTLLWILIAFLAGGVAVPVTSGVLWAMRARFVPDYRALKLYCERGSGVEVTSEQEERAEEWTEDGNRSRFDTCMKLSQALVDYQEAMPGRSLGFAAVLFISVLIIRFMILRPE